MSEKIIVPALGESITEATVSKWLKEKGEMVKLDDLKEEIAPEDYNMINIDVQGYELEVFRGAKNTLNNIQYVMTEVNRAELYKNCCMVEELDEFLGKYSFERKETTWEGQTWGDALYIKNETLFCNNNEYETV